MKFNLARLPSLYYNWGSVAHANSISSLPQGFEASFETKPGVMWQIQIAHVSLETDWDNFTRSAGY